MLRRGTNLMVADRTRRTKRSRRGFYSMELVLTLPLFGVLLLGLLEFSLLFYARGIVVDACRTGARRAAVPGAQSADVENEVWRVLPPRLAQSARVEVSGGDHPGEVVSVVVRVPMNTAAPNLLWPVGFDLTSRNLTAESRMIVE